MRPRRLLDKVAAGSVLVLAATLALPAAASDGPPMPSYAPSREQRDHWLDECSERLSASYRHERREDRLRERDRSRASCESYYDDYYAYYRSHRQAYGSQPAAYQPRRAQNQACDPSPDCQRVCTQTVEYEEEYVDVPVRAAPRRSKRVRVVPDKRIRLK